MDTNIKFSTRNDGIPEQTFNGKTYRLYTGERYFSIGRKRLHIEVWKHYNGEIQKGFDIHHKDENTFNNSIENLECIERNKHQSEHGKKRAKEFPDKPQIDYPTKTNSSFGIPKNYFEELLNSIKNPEIIKQ